MISTKHITNSPNFLNHGAKVSADADLVRTSLSKQKNALIARTKMQENPMLIRKI